MAQLKAIFIGRNHHDTGLSEYKLLAQRFNLKLDIHTHTPNAAVLITKYDYAFMPGYLSIIEALLAGVPVFAQYINALKYDYLKLSPFYPYIKLFQNPHDKVLNLNFNKKLIAKGKQWAATQTWTKLASIYEKLWQI